MKENLYIVEFRQHRTRRLKVIKTVNAHIDEVKEFNSCVVNDPRGKIRFETDEVDDENENAVEIHDLDNFNVVQYIHDDGEVFNISNWVTS